MSKKTSREDRRRRAFLIPFQETYALPLWLPPSPPNGSFGREEIDSWGSCLLVCSLHIISLRNPWVRPLQDLFSVFPLIESERLILRQVTPEDAPDFFACQSDPDVFSYAGRSEETSLESARDRLNILFKRHQEQTMLSWAIVLKENQRFLGKFQMEEWSDENHRATVGYLLGKQYWGNGYATEALRAVIAYLFEQTTVNRIDAFAWAENIASTRVMEKAGMRFEGLARQKCFAKGTFHDLKYYAILREDFFQWEGTSLVMNWRGILGLPLLTRSLA